jgi:hypothetical protein
MQFAALVEGRAGYGAAFRMRSKERSEFRSLRQFAAKQ